MNAAEFSFQVCAAPYCHIDGERKQTHRYTQIPIDCFISGKDTVYWHLHLLERETWDFGGRLW